MTSDNGDPRQVAALEDALIDADGSKTIRRLDRELGNTPKLRLDPNQLSIRDLKRARVALGGRDPWELLGDPLEAVLLTLWCLKSRDDPAYTMEMAEAEPLGNFDMSAEEPPPPPGATPSSPGLSVAPSDGNGSSAPPDSGGSAPSSSPSTASTPTSTTS